MLNPWPFRVSGPDNRHDIEANRVVQQSVLPQERERGARDASLFGEIDRIRRMASVRRTAGLHFHEDNDATVEGDEVQFPTQLAGLRARIR